MFFQRKIRFRKNVYFILTFIPMLIPESPVACFPMKKCNLLVINCWYEDHVMMGDSLSERKNRNIRKLLGSSMTKDEKNCVWRPSTSASCELLLSHSNSSVTICALQTILNVLKLFTQTASKWRTITAQPSLMMIAFNGTAVPKRWKTWRLKANKIQMSTKTLGKLPLFKAGFSFLSFEALETRCFSSDCVGTKFFEMSR